MDFHNTFLYHLVVAIVSFILVFILSSTGVGFNRAVAGVAFVLLFLTLIIGPIVRLFRANLTNLPWELPWSWRGELGIWFTIMSIIHLSFVFAGKQWDVIGYVVGMRLSDFVAFVALFLALVLMSTSFSRVIKFIGISSWKWLHSFTYVVFYLISAHVINHAFLRPDRPENWIHWLYLFMMIAVIVLQFIAFSKTVIDYRKSLKKEAA